MRQTKLYTFLKLSAALWAASSLTTAYALDLPGFRTCVSTGSAAICQLDPCTGGSTVCGPAPDSAWLVGSTINVTRSNITVQGTSAAVLGKLRRNTGTNPMMLVTGTSVTAKFLLFDGNKAQFPSNSNPTSDLEFKSPSWNNYVISSTFKNARDKALNVQYYTYIQYSNFYDAEHVGVLTFAQPANNATDIAITNSYFTGTGANAVYMQSGLKNSIISYGNFFANHKTCSWNSPGGQILLDKSTSGITIQNSTIDGNNTQCASYPQSSAGIEAYGTGHTIAANTVKQHKWFGMYFTAANNIQINGNRIESNGFQSASVRNDGLRLFGSTDLAAYPCSAGLYSVNNNIIVNNAGYGIKATRKYLSITCNAPNTATVTLTGNTLLPNGTGDKCIDPPPPAAPVCPL